ncbi:MAG: TolC family protein [Candidatus Korobacteraceae bacterium]
MIEDINASTYSAHSAGQESMRDALSFLATLAESLSWRPPIMASVLFAASCCVWAQNPASPQASSTTPQASPTAAHKLTVPTNPAMIISLDQAIELAKKNNPSLQAQRTLTFQNKEQEVTANLRPNPQLSWDAQYLPIFTPHLFSADYIDNTAQFDAGLSYLFERGQKRQHRLLAAKDATSVTESQVMDAERTLVANIAQQFVVVLLAKSNYDFAQRLLDSYQGTVGVSQQQNKAGTISNADLLKIQLQTLQFQTDATTAKIAFLQALSLLRQLIGFDSVPADFDVAGNLAYEPLTLRLEELQARALSVRPDFQAAQRSVNAAQSQIALAKANAKQDLNATFDYTHVSATNLAAFFFNIPLPIFNRNQGEVARNYYALTQSQFLEKAAEQQVLTDVKNAYEGLLSSEEVIELYKNGYLQQAQQSREMAESSYQRGGASMMDFLDAERSYRGTELSYRQALAAYMTALEQLRQAVGTRDLR